MKKILAVLLAAACFLPHMILAASEEPLAYAEAASASANVKNTEVLGGNLSSEPTLAYINGRNCWVLGTNAAENSSVYLDFDSAVETEEQSNYRLDITYYDYGRGRILLKYRDTNGIVSLKPIYCTGSGEWRTSSVELLGMKVDNSMSANYDIQVYTYDNNAWNTPANPVYISEFELYGLGTVQSSAITFTTGGMDKNFYSGNQSISYKLSNNMKQVRSFTRKHSAYDEDGNLLWTETAAPVKIGANSYKTYTVSMDIAKYGIHTLVVEISDSINGYARSECDFAVLKNNETDVKNYNFGISAHFSWEDRHLATVPLFTQMGAGFVRDEVLWEDYVNAGNAIPQRHQTFLNELVAAGVEPLLIFGPTPYYKAEDFPKTEEELKSFGEYVYGLVNDTKGKVKYFEVWNEYNAAGGDPTELGREYARLLRVAYSNAKAANPDCVIIGPVQAGWSLEFAAGMFEEDPQIADCLDVVSFHAYHREKLAEDSQFLDVRRACVADMKARFGEKEIWITEFGWCEDDYGITEREDAMYTVRYLMWNDDAKLYDKMFRYDWINDEDLPGAFGRNFGFLNSDHSVKKVYLACDAMNEILASASFVSKNIDSRSNYFYKYKVGSGKEITVVFNENDIEQTVLLEPAFRTNRLYDMYGNELPVVLKNGQAEVTVDGEPCYFVSTDEGVEMIYETNTAVVRGRIEGGRPGDPFMIYVMNPNQTKDDMLNADAINYIELGTVGEDGGYDFSFPMVSGAGEYKVYIGYQKGKKAIGPAVLSVKRDVSASATLFAGDKQIASIEDIKGTNFPTLKVQGNIDNRYNASLSAALYAAGYKGKTMQWIEKVDSEPLTVGDNEMSFEVDKSKALEADEIKIFLWKDDMTPLANQIKPIN